MASEHIVIISLLSFGRQFESVRIKFVKTIGPSEKYQTVMAIIVKLFNIGPQLDHDPSKLYIA
jgi:hypothetical protein